MINTKIFLPKIILHCLIIFVLFLFGCESRYNYKYYLNEDTNKKLIAKGNVNDASVPFGDFVIYDYNSNVIAEGSYEFGLKSGEWRHVLGGENYTVDWEMFNLKGYSLSTPDHWVIKNRDDYIFHATQLNSDSLVVSRFTMKSHKINEMGINSFTDFSEIYFEQAERSNLATKVDYTEYFTDNYSVDSVRFHQYFGEDDSGNEVVVFIVLIEANKHHNEEIIEISLVAPRNKDEYYYRLFTEIILDLHIDSKPVFNRWELSYEIPSGEN